MINYIEKDERVKIEITPKDLAELFANLDATEQAEFFNEVAICASMWSVGFEFQLQYITDCDELTIAGRRVMQGIGEYSHWGITPK